LTFFPRIRSSTPGAFAVEAGVEPAPGYRLRRLRGRGGFAEVWEADSPSGPVALKFMPSSNAGTTSREVRALGSILTLDHPYLVKTHHVWSVPGYIVIAMELAEATLLYHNDLGQHIDPPQLCLHLWQVAEGLDYLNARQHVREGRKVGFQHGDVKPNNILLFAGVAKLTDYGLAAPTHGPLTPCHRHGTRDYAAPEIYQGYLTDTSDQYSLAVTYHVLRTGVFPFPPVPPDGSGHHQPLAAAKSANRPPPDLSLLLPAEQPVLSRALAVIPQARFPTCRDLMRALLRAHGLKPVRTENGNWKVALDSEVQADQPSGRMLRDQPSARVSRDTSPKRNSSHG
jgi:serine/threonine protein kinase